MGELQCSSRSFSYRPQATWPQKRNATTDTLANRRGCSPFRVNGHPKDAIHELGEFMKKTGEVKDYDRFIEEVFDREKLVTTGIGNELAIPHARTVTVDNFMIVFGRSGEGVDFEAFDKKPVRLIFFMAIPSKDIDEYLKILAHLTRVLKKRDLVKGLYEAEKPEDIIRLFGEAEK